MGTIAIRAENVGKLYRLGTVGSGTLTQDLTQFVKRLQGKSDSIYAQAGENDRTKNDGNSIVWALQDINFEIPKGQVLGIIGRNGAGKSTLLKLLSRVTAPSTGIIKTNGQIASLLEVGTGFHPELTGRENIFLNGAILGMRKHEIRQKFDAIVDFAGVEKYVDTPVKRYSSGMYVRLAFAVAAHLEPEILIIDEVLAVGDTEFQKKCLAKMKDVSSNGRTILFVSHNIPSVKSLCSRCIYLKNGKLFMDGDTDKVIEVYQQENAQNDKKIITGNGQAHCINFHVKNGQGNLSDFIKMDESFSFELEIESKVSLNSVSIAVGINNNLEQRLTSYWSALRQPLFQLSTGKNIFKIHVSNCNLIPGSYDLVTYIGREGTVIEEIKNIQKLHVGISDNNPNEIIPVEGHGLFIEPFHIEKIQ